MSKFNSQLTGKITKILLSDDTERIWSKKELTHEFFKDSHSYEVIRRELLCKKIQKFEKTIFQQRIFNENTNSNQPECSHIYTFKIALINILARKNISIRSNTECQWLKEIDDYNFELIPIHMLLSENVKMVYLLIMIRKKFINNELPSPHIFHFMCEKYPNIKGETVSELYLSFVKYATKMLMAILK
ncbi:hypothetical protein [Chryseobacterium sp. ERMR1:04]|uniref:hypothetical protein n=1 Tax=Chryseobacterium sp. ERMR1:04 TaxID=1705393 RepID=UPI0006C8BC88|nr:hypothetical protein [Chryseobacterium sp. ERMR1:04]KPH14776.1 hypothetical protein AMQ68_04860 [Chryseobacterium sp. ERMR1:04]